MERRTGRDLGLNVRMTAALILLAVLYLPLPIGIVLFGRGWTGSWLLSIGSLAALFVFVCFLPAISERITLASARARVVGEQEEPELDALVQRLAGMADMPAPRIAVADTDVPNSFAAGRSPRDAVVVVTRGLRARLSPQELEAVLAHELTHIVNRDAFVMTLVGAPAMLGRRIFTWLADLPARVEWPAKVIVILAFLYCFFVLLLVWVLYAVATALIMTISRYREYVADRGAALLTGAPEQLQSALQRLTSEMPLIPREDLRAVAGVSALFIVPAEAPAGALEIDPQRMFSSHPPLERRLERLSDLARELGRSVRAAPEEKRRTESHGGPNPRALIAFFCAALYWCFVGSLWLGGGDPFQAAWPMALAWIGGVVLAIQAAGRASAGASGMGFAVGALALLVGPWVLTIAGVFVLFLLGSAGVFG
ncbi:MAG TPA: M48 family metalloprotease [Gaiellaceae bacterium]